MGGQAGNRSHCAQITYQWPKRLAMGRTMPKKELMMGGGLAIGRTMTKSDLTMGEGGN